MRFLFSFLSVSPSPFLIAFASANSSYISPVTQIPSPLTHIGHFAHIDYTTAAVTPEFRAAILDLDGTSVAVPAYGCNLAQYLTFWVQVARGAVGWSGGEGAPRGA